MIDPSPLLRLPLYVLFLQIKTLIHSEKTGFPNCSTAIREYRNISHGPPKDPFFAKVYFSLIILGFIGVNLDWDA